ncbi:hypothetical protein [Halomonas piscis]|uniref:hypothetical protein n=1 Tax=Halomonas piscis TaxID=3031727 RepID=UPI00289AC01B|nr:hypothetical protein [Halomonas piscis]
MAHPRYVGLRLSTQAGAVPTAADIAEGELAINTADGRVYTLAGSTIIDLTDRYTVSEIDTLMDGKANASHTHPWGEVTGKPATATRWPTFSEVTGKPASYPPSAHGHTLADISDAGTAAAKDVAEFDPAGAASSAVSGHESAPDPHSQYVKKATGKGLSSNDYTDGDKSKLAGIESGATADQTKADIDALGIDADTLDGKRADDFDPAGAAADAEQRIRQTLKQRPDPLLMHFL